MRICVIDINIIRCECGICGYKWEDSRSTPMFGVARYEDYTVPDDYKGEWGGMQVCDECFKAERELRKLYPEKFLMFREILLASRQANA